MDTQTPGPPDAHDTWLTGRSHRLLRAAWVVLVVVLLGYATTTVPGVREHRGYDAVIDGWLQNAVLVAATALIAVRALLVRTSRLGWGALAAGLGLYALGNILYFGWVQYDTTSTSPSVADVAWLTSYLFLYVGLVGLARARVQIRQRTLWLDGALGALGVSAVATVWLHVILHRAHGSLAAVLTTMAYPIGDLALLVIVLGTCGLLAWRPDRGWLELGAGLALFALADTIYVLRVATDSYQAGTMLDPLWAVAAVVMARAALRPPRQGAVAAAYGWSALAVPSAFVLLSLGLLVYGTERHLPLLAVGLATVTVLAGLTRAGITFLDVQVLSLSREQARTDELTGLGNRRRFHEVVAGRIEALARDERLAVLLLDLDRFKEVNDALGHTAGDRLLRSVGDRLAGHLRDSDLLVRLGGDEFAIMLTRASVESAESLAQRLRSSLQRAFSLDGVTVHVDVSIGIALCPEVASTVEGLLQRADIAMYQAKSDRTGTMVYEADEHDLTRRLRCVDELRQAIAGDQLVLHYQPKLDLRTGQVRDVEALVRWRHPERGLLCPDEFIPDAERYGFMRALTTGVLGTALDQVRSWRADGGPRRVAVNVSASSLLDTTLPDQVEAMLVARGLPGEALVVEITEGVLMVDPQRAQQVLVGLRSLGVTLSVDDFGTGYSSLGRLRDLPVSELKLDRSFVARMEDDERAAALVASTVQLAHSLGLELVAEGVETAGILHRLVAMGCDVAQGYLVGAPMEPEALSRTLRVPAPRHPALPPQRRPTEDPELTS